MPRFAANLSFLFTELPFLQRFEAAARAGFAGVEFHYPYGHDPYAVKAALDAQQLEPVLINIRAGDHAVGDWGFAGVPGREQTFRICLDEAIAYAEVIGVAQLNCLAGLRPIGADAVDCTATLAANLKLAAREAAKAGMRVNLEALNSIDVPRYLVSTSGYAEYVIEMVGEPNLKLQFDWYHAHMAGERIAERMRELLPVIGHMQFADAPGRHEPGSGEIDFPSLFALADELGYTGWLSAEYRPAGRTIDSLAWLSRATGDNASGG